MSPHARRVWVVAGPGGNGGDGLHAAACLQRMGYEVTVCLLPAPDRLSPDARRGLAAAQDAGVTIEPWPAAPMAGCDLAIDALLGLGASRAPEGPIAEAIAALNQVNCARLAIDLPSGLAADTGWPLGAGAVHATATLALLTLKPGLFTGAGRDHTGQIWFDDLAVKSLATDPVTARLTCRDDWTAVNPRRRHGTHKGSFGDALVVGGAPGMVGAARLAAHAALSAGAGRTFVSPLDPDVAHEDAGRPEWLWADAAWLPGRAALERMTVVCGCGGGTAIRQALPALLARSGRLVVDADALNAVAEDTALAAQLAARTARGLATVLTPHPLEAARLLGTTTADVQANRLASATALAARWNNVVVLKGSGSVIAAPAMTPRLNATGNAALAAGGTGDVLAGWIAGLWAQQAPGNADDPRGESSVAFQVATAARLAARAGGRWGAGLGHQGAGSRPGHAGGPRLTAWLRRGGRASSRRPCAPARRHAGRQRAPCAQTSCDRASRPPCRPGPVR